jgi:hypothetical protein
LKPGASASRRRDPISASRRQAGAPRAAAAGSWASRHLFRFRNASALAIALIVIAAAPTMYFTGANPRNSADDLFASAYSATDFVNTAGTDDADAINAVADSLNHYFGIEVTGHTIGYVVDGDAAMAGYINQVAFLTNSVNAAFPPGARRFGIAQAVAGNGKTIVEVAEPNSDLEGARSLLLARLPMGQTDLNLALEATSRWYPDQVFVVLANPVSRQRIEVLTQSALQTGAVVNVIALGDAAGQRDLSEISEATGGTFVAVGDQALDNLVERQKSAAQAEGIVAAL